MSGTTGRALVLYLADLREANLAEPALIEYESCQYQHEEMGRVPSLGVPPASPRLIGAGSQYQIHIGSEESNVDLGEDLKSLSHTPNRVQCTGLV